MSRYTLYGWGGAMVVTMGYAWYRYCLDSEPKGWMEELVIKHSALMDRHVVAKNWNTVSDTVYHWNALFRSVLGYLNRYVPKDTKYIGISLSGGVDSMLLMKILLKIAEWEKSGYSYEIVACHINYNNRYESIEEADALKEYCQPLGVIFHCRTLSFTRSNTDRSDYEEQSRGVRFEEYQYLKKKYGIQIFFVGHHADDLAENVYTNLNNRRNILSLSGMGEIGDYNGIVIGRPMFYHPKSDVLELAHSDGVPYFKDTTPQWSRRGKMRNEIFPPALKTFPKYLENLSRIGNESEDLNRDLDVLFFSNLYTHSSGGRFGVYLDATTLQTDLSFTLWKGGLDRLMHRYHHPALPYYVAQQIHRHLQTEGLFTMLSAGKNRIAHIFNQQLLILAHGKQIQTYGVGGTIHDYTIEPMTSRPLNPYWYVRVKKPVELTHHQIMAKIVEHGCFIFHFNFVPQLPIHFTNHIRANDSTLPHLLIQRIPVPTQTPVEDTEITTSPEPMQLELVWQPLSIGRDSE